MKTFIRFLPDKYRPGRRTSVYVAEEPGMPRFYASMPIRARLGFAGAHLAGFRDALRGYQQLGLAFDEAAAVVDMAVLLPREVMDAPDAVAAVSAARETLTRLGAAPHLARLEQALSPERTGGRPPAKSAAPDTAAGVKSR
jgi:hypothetical protein